MSKERIFDWLGSWRDYSLTRPCIWIISSFLQCTKSSGDDEGVQMSCSTGVASDHTDGVTGPVVRAGSFFFGSWLRLAMMAASPSSNYLRSGGWRAL
jgi:hypothetical protein